MQSPQYHQQPAYHYHHHPPDPRAAAQFQQPHPDHSHDPMIAAEAEAPLPEAGTFGEEQFNQLQEKANAAAAAQQQHQHQQHQERASPVRQTSFVGLPPIRRSSTFFSDSLAAVGNSNGDAEGDQQQQPPVSAVAHLPSQRSTPSPDPRQQQQMGMPGQVAQEYIGQQRQLSQSPVSFGGAPGGQQYNTNPAAQYHLQQHPQQHQGMPQQQYQGQQYHPQQQQGGQFIPQGQLQQPTRGGPVHPQITLTQQQQFGQALPFVPPNMRPGFQPPPPHPQGQQPPQQQQQQQLYPNGNPVQHIPPQGSAWKLEESHLSEPLQPARHRASSNASLRQGQGQEQQGGRGGDAGEYELDKDSGVSATVGTVNTIDSVTQALEAQQQSQQDAPPVPQVPASFNPQLQRPGTSPVGQIVPPQQHQQGGFVPNTLPRAQTNDFNPAGQNQSQDDASIANKHHGIFHGIRQRLKEHQAHASGAARRQSVDQGPQSNKVTGDEVSEASVDAGQGNKRRSMFGALRGSATQPNTWDSTEFPHSPASRRESVVGAAGAQQPSDQLSPQQQQGQQPSQQSYPPPHPQQQMMQQPQQQQQQPPPNPRNSFIRTGSAGGLSRNSPAQPAPETLIRQGLVRRSSSEYSTDPKPLSPQQPPFQQQQQQPKKRFSNLSHMLRPGGNQEAEQQRQTPQISAPIMSSQQPPPTMEGQQQQVPPPETMNKFGPPQPQPQPQPQQQQVNGASPRPSMPGPRPFTSDAQMQSMQQKQNQPREYLQRPAQDEAPGSAKKASAFLSGIFKGGKNKDQKQQQQQQTPPQSSPSPPVSQFQPRPNGQQPMMGRGGPVQQGYAPLQQNFPMGRGGLVPMHGPPFAPGSIGRGRGMPPGPMMMQQQQQQFGPPGHPGLGRGGMVQQIGPDGRPIGPPQFLAGGRIMVNQGQAGQQPPPQAAQQQGGGRPSMSPQPSQGVFPGVPSPALPQQQQQQQQSPEQQTTAPAQPQSPAPEQQQQQQQQAPSTPAGARRASDSRPALPRNPLSSHPVTPLVDQQDPSAEPPPPRPLQEQDRSRSGSFEVDARRASMALPPAGLAAKGGLAPSRKPVGSTPSPRRFSEARQPQQQQVTSEQDGRQTPTPQTGSPEMRRVSTPSIAPQGEQAQVSPQVRAVTTAVQAQAQDEGQQQQPAPPRAPTPGNPLDRVAGQPQQQQQQQQQMVVSPAGSPPPSTLAQQPSRPSLQDARRDSGASSQQPVPVQMQGRPSMQDIRRPSGPQQFQDRPSLQDLRKASGPPPMMQGALGQHPLQQQQQGPQGQPQMQPGFGPPQQQQPQQPGQQQWGPPRTATGPPPQTAQQQQSEKPDSFTKMFKGRFSSGSAGEQQSEQAQKEKKSGKTLLSAFRRSSKQVEPQGPPPGGPRYSQQGGAPLGGPMPQQHQQQPQFRPGPPPQGMQQQGPPPQQQQHGPGSAAGSVSSSQDQFVQRREALRQQANAATHAPAPGPMGPSAGGPMQMQRPPQGPPGAPGPQQQQRPGQPLPFQRQQSIQQYPASEPQYETVPIPGGYQVVHGEGMVAPSPYVVSRHQAFAAPHQPYGVMPYQHQQPMMGMQGMPQQWGYPGQAPPQQVSPPPPPQSLHQVSPPPQQSQQIQPPPAQFAQQQQQQQQQQQIRMVPQEQQQEQPAVQHLSPQVQGQQQPSPHQGALHGLNATSLPQGTPGLSPISADSGRITQLSNVSNETAAAPRQQPAQIITNMEEVPHQQQQSPQSYPLPESGNTFSPINPAVMRMPNPPLPGQPQQQQQGLAAPPQHHQQHMFVNGATNVPQRQISAVSQVSSIHSMVPPAQQAQQQQFSPPAGDRTVSPEPAPVQQINQQLHTPPPQQQQHFQSPVVAIDTDRANALVTEEENIYDATPRKPVTAAPAQVLVQQEDGVHEPQQDHRQQQEVEREEQEQKHQQPTIQQPAPVHATETVITPPSPVESPSPVDGQFELPKPTSLAHEEQVDPPARLLSPDVADAEGAGQANGSVARSGTIRATSAEVFEEHKRKMLLRDMEEKIAVFPEEPEQNGGLGGGKKGGAAEEEVPQMSATSYPGQEWNPYGEFAFDDED